MAFKPYPVQSFAPTVEVPTGVVSQPSGPGVVPMAAHRNTSNIHEAITNKTVEDIEKIIRDDPRCVNERGFNGQVPLHKAAIRGAPEMVDLLLRFKADPNIKNSYDETPFHYACKRGQPMCMHTLVEAGVDIHAVDNAGRGPMHQAALGGSVLAMHYILEVLHLSPNVQDSSGSTPLHLVCQHGHLDALKYLLRKERADFMARDYQGNTPLHVAAQFGYGWSCWKLISDFGLRLLHETNREGKIPVDLARQGKQFKYKSVAKLLAYYSDLPFSKGEKAVGPLLSWYFHLALPVIAYPLILLVIQIFTNKGIPLTIGMLALVFTLYRHSHRMLHVSGWPNSIFMGTFASGFFHTMFCFYIEVMQYTHQDHPGMTYVSILSGILMLYMYIKLLTGNPGVVNESARKDNGEHYTILDIAKGKIRLQAWCPECEVIPPHRARHCRLCEKCYYACDHHCLFLYRCVAKLNHRFFVLFITLVLLSMVMFEYMCVQYIKVLYPDSDYGKGFVWDFFNQCPWVFSCMITNFVSVIWGVILLKFQINVISKGMTTAYQPNMGKTSLSNKQRFRNVLNFFAGRPPYALDPVAKSI